jgi:hypothetical protein
MPTSNIKSDAYELDWLEYLFQATNFPAAFSFTGNGPAAVKLCLFKSDPRTIQGSALPAIDGIGSVEPTSGEYLNYARLSITRNTTEWTTATAAGASTVKKATSDAVFATAGGGSNVSITYVGVAIAKQDGSGDCLLYAWQLDTPITVTAGIAPRIGVNDLVHEQK